MENKKSFDREYVSAMFAQHRVLAVTFIKEKDGSERHMVCTQDLALVPVEKHPKSATTSTSPKPPSDVSCNVWEIDNGWRSFKYKSVINIIPGVSHDRVPD